MRQLKITKSITARKDGCMESYLQEVSRIGMLTADEESDIAFKMRNAKSEIERNAARELLIRSNLRFVISCAKRYSKPNISLTDIIQEGNIGLMMAADNFDVTKGFKFISYAVWWIRQSIMKFLSDHTSMIRLPLNKINRLNKIFTFISQYQMLHETPPSSEEIAEHLNITTEEVDELLADHSKSLCMSMDATLSEDGDDCFSSFIPSEMSTDEFLVKESDNQSIIRILDKLSVREKFIICNYFGIGCKERTIEEISADLDLTKERVRQLKVIALNKLKNKYSKELGKLIS